MSLLTIIGNYLLSLFHKTKPTNPVTPSSVSPTVAVINESSVMTDAELTPIINALQIQCDRDFGPIWNVDCKLVQIFKGQQIPANAWQLVIADDSQQVSILGYHSLTQQGNPVAFVFAKTDIENGNSVSVTLSHECLEFLADGGCDLMAQNTNTTAVAFECGDPVQDDSSGYKINDILLSDFVTPYWFLLQPPTNAKMDFVGHIQPGQPFTLAPGGYISIWDPANGGWTQQTSGELKRPPKPRA